MTTFRTFLIVGILCAGINAIFAKQSRSPRAEKQKASTATQAGNSSIPTGNGFEGSVTLEDVLAVVSEKIDALGERGEHRNIILLTEADLLPNGYTITAPGYYMLSDAVEVDSSLVTEYVIRINASNVVLDFNDQTIYQTTGDSKVGGVTILDGLNNIVIKRGKISGMRGNGITIGKGSHDVTLSGMTVQGCSGNGISCIGTSVCGSKDIRVSNSEFSSNGDVGGVFLHAEKVRIINSSFVSNACVGVLLSHGSCHEIRDSQFSSNEGEGDVAGLVLDEIKFARIKKCSFSANVSKQNKARGLVVAGTGNAIENCTADGNTTAAVASAAGYEVTGVANIFYDCSATCNTSSEGGAGFLVAAGARQCCLKKCSALANSHRGFENFSEYGANVFVSNFSCGHGLDKNYSGEGIGFVVRGIAAQSASGALENELNNISVV